MRKDTERVLTVLLALALTLLAITAFALAKAQQRIRLNEIANGTHATVSDTASRTREQI
jgi:Tfp pilus assembly protein PilX